MASLQGKTLFITGASRGIGLAIALKAAAEGANIAIAAKTDKPHPKLEGTIHTAAAAVEKAGGKALPLVVDVRDEDRVHAAVEQAALHFGGIDICVNNASAISLTGTLVTEMKRFDLMHDVNTRGTFLVSKACVPHLRQADNPHVLNISPPLDLTAGSFAPHLAYSLAKFGIAFNALWPRTTIATAAIQFALIGQEGLRSCRKPQIMADAACKVFLKPARDFTGQFLIDDTFLYEEGERDFDKYRVDPSNDLLPDFFVPDSMPPPPGVTFTAKR
jgi:citronellol/citronellal dehydrogenase